MQSSSSKLVVWQVLETGERSVVESKLNSFHLETGLLHFELQKPKSLNGFLPIFFYSRDGLFIFKTKISDMKSNVFSVTLPDEIKLLEEPDITFIKGSAGVDLAEPWKVKRLNFDRDRGPDYMKVKSMAERSTRDQDFLNNEFSVSLDEEEKMYADKRESPRARPKADKWVKVLPEGSDDPQLLKLFDLSQGGIGFVTMEKHMFPKGSKILVVGFAEFDLDDPLIGQVMSHRPIDDTKIEWKIGCKFDEGQS